MEYISMTIPKGIKDDADLFKLIALKIGKSLTRKVRIRLQKFDFALLSGEDSGLENTWDEICVQVQQEYSIHWEEYVNTISKVINSELERLDNSEQCALWFLTKKAEDWYVNREFEEEEVEAPIFGYDVTKYLVEEVLSLAGSWSNKKIRDYIY